MSSLRHITLPGAFILLATLALRMETAEAEWLVASLLHMRVRLGAVLVAMPGTAPMRRIIHPHGF